MALRSGRLLALSLALALPCAGPVRAAGEPVNRGAPTLTLDGGTLTTSDGTWVGRTRPYAYAWFRCTGPALSSCVQVPGETANAYVLSDADAGMRIRSRVTASNEAGSAESFSAPTSAVARTAPAPGASAPPKRLAPFPVVVVAGRNRGARTRVTELVVRGPRTARVSVVCRGPGCPMKRAAATIGTARRLRLRVAERLYRVGQVLELRVTGENRIGKFTRIHFRRDDSPARKDACLQPGSTRPSTCLTS